MRNLLLFSLCLSFSISITNAQTFYQSPILTNYLDNSIGQSPASFWGEMPYSGIGKQFLINHIPSANYGVLLMPMTGESGFFTPMYARPIIATGNKMSLSLKGSFNGEQEVGLGTRFRIKKVSGSLYGNGYFLDKAIDKNEDNFLDLPKRTRYIGMNTWNWQVGKWRSSNVLYYLNLQEQGGEVDFDKATDFQTTNAYGTGHDVQNYGVITSHNYDFSKNKIQRKLYLRGNARQHQQTSYYGNVLHQADETWIDGYLGYSYKKLLDKWEIGMKYRYQNVENQFDTWRLDRKEIAYGGYTHYETYLHKYLKLKAQLTVEKHNLLDWRVVPALQLYSQVQSVGRFGVFAGRDIRYANVLAEYTPYFASARTVNIAETLRPEEGWYIGAGGNFQIPDFDIYLWDDFRVNFGNLNVVWRHGFYDNQIVADFISDPDVINFSNLEGDAYRQTFEVGTSINIERLHFSFLYRYQNAKITVQDQLRDMPFYSKNSWFGALKYDLPKQIRTSVRYFYQSPQYIAQRDLYSNSNHRWDLYATVPMRQLFRNQRFLRGMMIELGWQNLTNSRQMHLVQNSQSPFDAGFDAGQVWGNTVGSRFYTSLRYSF